MINESYEFISKLLSSLGVLTLQFCIITPGCYQEVGRPRQDHLKLLFFCLLFCHYYYVPYAYVGAAKTHHHESKSIISTVDVLNVQSTHHTGEQFTIIYKLTYCLLNPQPLSEGCQKIEKTCP